VAGVSETDEEGGVKEALETIRDMAMDHPCFDGEAFEKRDMDALTEVGGDVCDWTVIAIIADDALKGKSA